MITKKLSTEQFNEFIGSVIASHDQIIAPKMTDREIVKYLEIKDAKELVWENPTYPPKNYFLPHGEVLVHINDRQFANVDPDNRSRAIFITPADMNGIFVLDHLFLDRELPDPLYRAKRSNTLFICIKTDASKNMFDIETGLNMSHVRAYDLYVEKVEDGYLIETGSLLGINFLEKTDYPDHNGRVNKEIEVNRRINLNQLRRAQDEYQSPVWEIASKKCLSCGSCTNICPTCGCYDVFDEPEMNITDGKRVRMWDGCQYLDFTQVAGGEVFRESRSSRFKHRYYHKIKYYPDDYNVLGCIGCGRCIDVCPTKIDMVDLIQQFGPRETEHDTEKLFLPQKVEIINIVEETEDIKTFRVKTDMKYQPGQFVQISVPLIGEAPISICSYASDYMELNIREVGRVTNALGKLQVGDYMYIRGPYGNGYEVEKFHGKNVIIIAGGTGVAPIKGVINYMAQYREKFKDVDLFFGFRSPTDVLFRDEIFSREWEEKFDMHLTVDKLAGCVDWDCDVGLITKILDDKKPQPSPDTEVIVCGPPIMIKFVIQSLEKLGFKDNQIWMSLERMMKCGVGKCGHCMIGGKYGCKDGPVFNYAVVRTLTEA